jgi:phosphohistidine phosphatase
LIITSNAYRALETADNIQRMAFHNIERMVDEKLYSGGKNDYLKTLKKLKDKYNSVMVIGHNPVIREVAAYFMDVSLYNICFPKASVYSFRIDCDSWKAISNRYSELTLYIKKDHIEKLSSNRKDKKKIDSLENQYNKTITLLNAIKLEGFKTGYTHDLRIINRKWLSIIDFSKKNDELNRIISDFLSKTGKYRDVCVQTKILKKLNGEQQIYRYWKKRKKKTKTILTKKMKDYFSRDIKTLFFEYYHELASQEEPFQKEVIKRDLFTSIENLRTSKELCSEHDLLKLHQFRLKAKAVRYKIEFYNAFFHTFEYKLEDLIYLQKKIGKIRDLQKLVNHIEKKKKRFSEKEFQETIEKIETKTAETWKKLHLFLEKNNFYLQTGG